MRSLVAEVRTLLTELLRLPDGYEIVLANGGPTAFWHCAAFGLIDSRSQHLVYGYFGELFAAAIAAAPWLEAPDVRTAPVGRLATPEAVAGVDVYAWPENETSTGVLAPVRRVVADPGALTVIDATSSAGATEVDLSECDVYYFGPQKNLGADGGLWFAALSPAAIERIERVASAGRFIPEVLSLKSALENSRLEQTLNTPPVTSLLLLREQLAWILANGGLAWAAARVAESSSALYAWAEASAYATPFVADPDARSPTVVTIELDPEIEAATLAACLRENGIVDTEGFRTVGGNQLRIATFVSIEPEDVRRLIGCIEYTVERLR